jgi:hypothetical protein
MEKVPPVEVEQTTLAQAFEAGRLCGAVEIGRRAARALERLGERLESIRGELEDITDPPFIDLRNDLERSRASLCETLADLLTARPELESVLRRARKTAGADALEIEANQRATESVAEAARRLLGPLSAQAGE